MLETQSNTDPAPTADDRAGLTHPIASALAFALSLAVPVALMGFLAAGFLAIAGLGALFKLDTSYSVIVAGATMLLILGHAAGIARAGTNAGRMLHGAALTMWLLLAVFFSATYAAMNLAGVTPTTPPAQMDTLLQRAFLPGEVVYVGRLMYALAFALGLITSVVSIVAAYVMGHPLTDPTNHSIGEAFARSGETVILALVVASSALHVFRYGLDFAGMDVFASLTAAAMAELTFIVSEKRAIAEIRRRAGGGAYDAFDLVAWVALGVFALGYMIVINLLYARLAAGMPANGDLFTAARDFYGISAPVFGGLLAVLSVLTAWVNVRRTGAPTPQANTRPWLVRRAGDLQAGALAWRELRDTLRAPQAPQLTAGATFESKHPTTPAAIEQAGTDTENARAEVSRAARKS